MYLRFGTIWIYGYEHLSLDETANFFREKLLKNEISLPDAYVLFWAEEDEICASERRWIRQDPEEILINICA